MDLSSKIHQNLEESLLSRILNAVEIFMEEEDSIPRNGEDDNSIRFRYLIDFFLGQAKDFDILSPNYATLLHFIVKHGDIESFKSLIQDSRENFDVNAISSKGTSLIHIVATNGSCEMMQMLLDRGANINIRTGRNDAVEQHLGPNNNYDEMEGYTPLHCAAFAGNLEVLEMLLDKGADINALSYYGTPLHFACGEINGNLEHDYLLKRKSYWPENEIIPNVNRVKVVKMLLERGAKVDVTDSNNKSALQRACFNWNFELVEVLVDHIAPV